MRRITDFVKAVAVTIRRVYSPRFVVTGRDSKGNTFQARVWADCHGSMDDGFRFVTRAAAEAYADLRNTIARCQRSGFQFSVTRSWEV